MAHDTSTLEGYDGNDDCDRCGSDLPCFDHYDACRNDVQGCGGTVDTNACRKCRAAAVPNPMFGAV